MVTTETGDAEANWRRTTFYHQLENGLDELVIDLADCDHLDFNLIKDVSAQGHKHLVSYGQSIREARFDGPDGLLLLLLDDNGARKV